MCTSICIYGAGAIGLDLAWHCIQSSHAVTLIARGRTLEALKSHGLVNLASKETIPPAAFRVVASSAEAGPHSIVLLTTKADDLLEIAAEIPPLLFSDTVVVSATNGVPPWYSYLQDTTIGRFQFPLEPRTHFLSKVPPGQLVGAIVERSVELQEPGVIRRSSGKGYTLGELDHRISDRCAGLGAILSAAGCATAVSPDIHRDIWLKLIGNVTVNPLSVVTQQSIGDMLSDPQNRRRMGAVAREAEQVGLRLGVIRSGDFNEDVFFSFMRDKLGHHHTSMLQDFSRGRPLEVHRILDVVEMLARAPGPVAPVNIPGVIELRREINWKLGRRQPIEISP